MIGENFNVQIAFKGFKPTHYSIEYWNVYLTNDEILLYFQGESFRNFFIKWEVESEEIGTTIQIQKVLEKNEKNHSIKRNDVSRIFIKWGNFLTKEKLCIELKDGTKYEFILARGNRDTIFNHLLYTEYYKTDFNYLNLLTQEQS